MKRKWFFGALASAAASLLLAVSSFPLGAAAAWKQTGLMGDLNGDGAVNVADIVVLSKHLHGTEKLTENSIFRLADNTDYTLRLEGRREVKPAAGTKSIQKADLDQNGAVEVFDLVALRKVVISDIPCGVILKWEEDIKPTATATTTTTAATTTTTTTAPLPPEPQKDFIEPPVKNMYGSMPSQGKVNLLVFYVDFPDCKFNYEPTVEEIENITFGPRNEDSANYPFESMSAFYSRASKGALELSGKAYKYTCKHGVDTYGPDIYKSAFAEEVVRNMDSAVDYTQFDADGDKIIDAVLFCVPVLAGNDDWWPCAGQYFGNDMVVDGMQLGHMITGNAAINSFNNYVNFTSTYLHEMGHCMGLPDYYLYTGDEDFEGMHGSAGYDLMDEAYSDFSAASKLMLGWMREDQVMVYDPSKGDQTFTLVNGQSDGGNCLIIPRGDLNGYKSEFFVVEYLTLDDNNFQVKPHFWWRKTGSGISVKHIEASEITDEYGTFFKYESGQDHYTDNNNGRRFIRLVDDAEDAYLKDKDNFFRTGAVISNSINGFAWYDRSGRETVDPGIIITVGENRDNTYTVTVSRK